MKVASYNKELNPNYDSARQKIVACRKLNSQDCDYQIPDSKAAWNSLWLSTCAEISNFPEIGISLRLFIKKREQIEFAANTA